MRATRMLLAACAATLLVAAPVDAAITLTPISTPFNQMVGIDYHEPTNKLIVTVNYPSGNPYNFELVSETGARSQYGTTRGLTDELKVATVRSGPCQGGFAPGDTFSGTGIGGHILRISPDGSTVQQPWVALPGELGLLRGGLFQDRYCVAGGDLVVVTTRGGVWRITSAGTPTRVANLGVHLEGVSTFPDDPARYGPWAGKIVAGAESQNRFYVIDPVSGAVTSMQIDGIQPEDIDIIPSGENFFGVNYGQGRLMGADAAQFAGMAGDVLVTQEFPGRLHRLRWNGSAFTSEILATVPQWEHVTFAPSGVVEVPPVNRPPVADAGADRVVAQTGPAGATVTLDGTGSSDPDGDTLAYSWSTGSTDAQPAVTAPVGTTTYTLTVSDGRGGSATDSVDVTVTADGSPPTITGTRSPSANPFGWNNEPVTVHFDCADDESGISSCSPDETLSGEGAGQSVTGTAINNAGLSAHATVSAIHIDLTDPQIAFSGNAGTYDVDDQVTIGCTVGDALSGLAAAHCPSVDAPAHTLGSGTRTLEATATDRADNDAAASTTYTVAATAEGLCALVERFVEHDGIANSLCAKLRAAASAQDRGQANAHDNIMDAFRSEVAAQAGRHGLTEDEARTLTDLSHEV